MEEKKRKGYKTQEQQNEANKRYRATEEGKKNTKHSTYKSRARVFINEMATFEELEELEKILKNKKMEVLKMEGFERLGTGWFALKDEGVDVYLVALKKDVVIEPNTMWGCYMAYLKENANCLTEQELKKFFLDKTGKEYTAEELRKPSTYKKYLDELVILNFAYANDEFIRTTSELLKSF